MKRFGYWLLTAWLYVHAWLPLRVLYLLSSLLYYPIYYVVKYRRKVVRRAMARSFAHLSERERLQIERKFYRHFCDIFVETIKLLHISDKEMKQRVKFENIEALKAFTDEGKSCIVLLGHFGNWEWIPSITLWTEGVGFAQIYRPLKSRYFDAFFLKLRSRFGSTSIPKQDTLRRMVGFKRGSISVVTGFIADQTPSPANIHYWDSFLGRPTAMLTGAEKIATKLDMPVLYIDVTSPQRGYYTVHLEVIAVSPKELPEFEITHRYTKLMEKSILRAPHLWLWTHNRWKHERLYNPNNQ